MKEVSPYVSIIARSMPDDDAIVNYLEGIGADDYARENTFEEPADIVEFGGRMCYRSWQPGLNPNVKKVRGNQADYIKNILSSAHGSVLEHVTWTFILQDVSRILTHELVRHRAGTAVSQESMRYVRLTHIPMWFPTWALEDAELMEKARVLLWQMEQLQEWMAGHFGLDEPETGFVTKKDKTSFMRRLAPAGHATSMVWTANVRALRHVIETRTAPGAELEIRLVFSSIAKLLIEDSPLLFGDFTEQEDGSWKPEWSKV